VPRWVVILNAADGDPLRAQEIESELNQYWWEHWLVYREEQGKAQAKMSEKHDRMRSRRGGH